IRRRWADLGGGASFQAPSLKAPRAAPPEEPEVPAPPEPHPGSRRALCKFWMSNGTCQRAKCQNFHPAPEELQEARLRWRREQQQRLALNAQPDDPHADKKSHGARAAVFAQWLEDTYGERLKRGVLDIGGGRGELAFELSVKRQIPCTVLDPRCPGTTEPALWQDWHVSRQQRLWLKSQGIRSYGDCQAHVLACPLKQCGVRVDQALSAVENKDPVWAEALQCEVVVGLHPDQATGGVLDLASKLQRPFAVVPCCTFADEFP
ncbi:unnamed protein product, partial [Effrenium voratum]